MFSRFEAIKTAFLWEQPMKLYDIMKPELNMQDLNKYDLQKYSIRIFVYINFSLGICAFGWKTAIVSIRKKK